MRKKMYINLIGIFLAHFFLCNHLLLSQVYLNIQAPPHDRVVDLMSRMTLDQKLSVLSYDNGGPRNPAMGRYIGIGPTAAADGPLGCRDCKGTAFPSSILLGASWNDSLTKLVGEAIAKEVNAYNKNILLAPYLNLMRMPTGGRNFESFSEDPFLVGKQGAAYIQGVQSQGVIATAKHFLLNEQEAGRMYYTSEIDSRSLHEMYIHPFIAAIQEGNVKCIMGAYNKFRGTYCCENKFLLTDLLRKMYGYSSFLITDWGALKFASTVGGVKAGMDLEAERGFVYTLDKLKAAITSGAITEKETDSLTYRILYASIAGGYFDGFTRLPNATIHCQEHIDLSSRAAEEGMVLLKNEGNILPLSKNPKTIALIGLMAMDSTLNCGGGAGAVTPVTKPTTFYDGISQIGGSEIKLVYKKGYDWVSIGSSFTPVSDDILTALRNEAVAAAQAADVVIVFTGWTGWSAPYSEAEGRDRTSIDDIGGDKKIHTKLVQEVAKVNSNVIVVNVSGGPCTLPWAQSAKGIVQAWFAGERYGLALGRLLFGERNFSGKLPITFPAKLEDWPAKPGSNNVVNYSEGIFNGYRHFDKPTTTAKPIFYFGYGLSYSTFTYSNLIVNKTSIEPSDSVNVQFTITNSGGKAGAEISQLYIGAKNPTLPRPIKELKGYHKVYLNPGQSARVSIKLPSFAFAFFDTTAYQWKAEKGSYDIFISSSSRFPQDLKLSSTVVIANSAYVKPVGTSSIVVGTSVEKKINFDKSKSDLYKKKNLVEIFRENKNIGSIKLFDSRGRLIEKITYRNTKFHKDHAKINQILTQIHGLCLIKIYDQSNKELASISQHSPF